MGANEETQGFNTSDSLNFKMLQIHLLLEGERLRTTLSSQGEAEKGKEIFSEMVRNNWINN